MKFTILSTALFAATSVLGAALPEPHLRVTRTIQEATLTKRQAGPATCGANIYQVDAQNTAFSAAQTQETAGTKIKALKRPGKSAQKYPRRFGNREGIPFANAECTTDDIELREFPILSSGDAFSRGVDQGPDRIIYIVTGKGSDDKPNAFAFCGLITHTGAPVEDENGYVGCT